MGAILDYDQAIQINPSYDLAYNGRAAVKQKLAEEGDQEGRGKIVSKSLESKETPKEAYKAVEEKRKKTLSEALSDLDTAISLNPAFEMAYYNRGDVKLSLGDVSGAIIDLTESIRLNPRSVDSYRRRSLAYSYSGDSQGQIKDISKVMEFVPNYADAYFERGKAYQSTGDRDKAVSDFQKASRIYKKKGNRLESEWADNRIKSLLEPQTR